MNLKVIIIEDELPAQKVLKNYIQDLPYLELVECFNNALDAIQFLQKQKVDLIFLDINLPKLSGLDFLKTIPRSPKVIITTAYPDFALEGFELDVVDYLLKPFSFQRFLKAVGKVGPNTMIQKPAETAPKSEMKHFFVKVDKVFYKINLEDLLYIKSEKDFVRIFTKDQNYMVLQSLKYYENILPSNAFIRIHKSYLINLSKVEKVFGNRVLIANEELPIGRTYKDLFIHQLNHFN